MRQGVVVWRWAGMFRSGERSGDAGTNVGADLGTGMERHVESTYESWNVRTPPRHINGDSCRMTG
jgi:hypothetical protein